MFFGNSDPLNMYFILWEWLIFGVTWPMFRLKNQHCSPAFMSWYLMQPICMCHASQASQLHSKQAHIALISGNSWNTDLVDLEACGWVRVALIRPVSMKQLPRESIESWCKRTSGIWHNQGSAALVAKLMCHYPRCRGQIRVLSLRVPFYIADLPVVIGTQ